MLEQATLHHVLLRHRLAGINSPQGLWADINQGIPPIPSNNGALICSRRRVVDLKSR